MEADKTLLHMKFARVVARFAEQQKISAEKALEFFYHSETYRELSEGIADLHCRSDQYVADELKAEYREVSDPARNEEIPQAGETIRASADGAARLLQPGHDGASSPLGEGASSGVALLGQSGDAARVDRTAASLRMAA